MAIYHFSMRVLTRSKGHAAVGAAAHQAGERLTDVRTGKVYDFSRKPHVVHAEILLPEGTPAWMRDRGRAAIWNEVERCEDRSTRYDTAQIAREGDIALPRELSALARLVLIRLFAREQFVQRGMVCDFAIHEPVSEGDGLVQAHAHLLLTMRQLTPQGFGKKVRDWGSRVMFNAWREAWAEHVNAALERAGIAARIDHRSLKAQHIAREPAPHIGRTAWEMEQRGRVTRRGARWLEVRERNVERERGAEREP
jgi:ATP-dependent exoDNAse (exonuclease V) alpha subunit